MRCAGTSNVESQHVVQLGVKATEGLGAGTLSKLRRAAAEESTCGGLHAVPSSLRHTSSPLRRGRRGSRPCRCIERIKHIGIDADEAAERLEELLDLIVPKDEVIICRDNTRRYPHGDNQRRETDRQGERQSLAGEPSTGAGSASAIDEFLKLAAEGRAAVSYRISCYCS